MATISQDKKALVDLVNKIRYEVTDEQLAELAGRGSSLADTECVDWHAWINRLNLREAGRWLGGRGAARLRAFLHRVLGLTRKVGGKTVCIGKRLIRWIASLLGRFPSTTAAAVVIAALIFAFGQIPLFGQILLPIVQLFGAALLGHVFLKELFVGLNRECATNR